MKTLEFVSVAEQRRGMRFVLGKIKRGEPLLNKQLEALKRNYPLELVEELLNELHNKTGEPRE